MVTNPYAQWEGYGRVDGREKIIELDENNVEGETLPAGHPAYSELGAYLPKQGETRLLFVVRCAATHPLTKVPYLKLFPAGEWEVPAVDALKELTFTAANPNSLPLISDQDIHLQVPKWRAYGRVEIRELNKPDMRKLYSRVMFQNIANEKLRVGTYWCWPY